MKAEEQRILIAEWCGWKHGFIEENSFADPRKVIKHERWISPSGIPQRCCPDYLNDLNAVAEAEKLLTPQHWRVYSDKLMVILRDSDLSLNGSNIEARYKTPHATAAQRSEALLHTLNLWKET